MLHEQLLYLTHGVNVDIVISKCSNVIVHNVSVADIEMVNK